MWLSGHKRFFKIDCECINAVWCSRKINANRRIYNSFSGGLIFSERNITLDNAYSFDINSALPCSVKRGAFLVPNLGWEIYRVKRLTRYRVVIKKSGDEKIDRLFRFNGFYAHYDIATARRPGLKMCLIQDGEANALFYPKRANGSQYFTLGEICEIQQITTLQNKNASTVHPIIPNPTNSRNNLIFKIPFR
jgi:hypothetical protein